MSNGLCFNAGRNQFISVQGCTDPDVQGCKTNGNICGSDKFGKAVGYENSSWVYILLTWFLVLLKDSRGYATVWLCEAGRTDSKMKYCCGSINCCNSSDQNSLEIDIATDLFKPPQASTSTSSAPTSATSASGGTSQPTHDGSNNSGSDSSRALAIGLGVGIPMGLGLLGSIVFLGLQVRKWAAAAAKQANESTGDGGNDSPQENKRDDKPNSDVQRQELHSDPAGVPEL